MAKKNPTEYRHNNATIRLRGSAWQADIRRGGQRYRRSFPFDAGSEKSSAAALADARTCIDQIDLEYQSQTRPLSIVEAEEARRALQMLPAGISLIEAARSWLKCNNTVAERLPIAEAAARYVQEKADTGMRERTVRSARIQTNRLALAFPQCTMDTITTRDLHAWVDRLKLKSPVTRNNLIRDISTFFNWATERGLAATNPALGIPLSAIEDELPEIYDIQTVQSLFTYLEANGATDLIPYHALGFFAGVRTTELSRLTDENIVDGIIQVTPKAAKTRSWRYIEMEPNLRQWLMAYPPKGPIQRCSRTRIDNQRQAAGMTWINNVMRHSFATYHLARYRDAGRTAHDLGHPNANLIYSTYRSLAQVADGEKYFQIKPTNL